MIKVVLSRQYSRLTLQLSRQARELQELQTELQLKDEQITTLRRMLVLISNKLEELQQSTKE